MIGRLLRDVYERRPENFPIPLGDEDPYASFCRILKLQVNKK